MVEQCWNCTCLCTDDSVIDKSVKLYKEVDSKTKRKIRTWADPWKVTFESCECEAVILFRNRNPSYPTLFFGINKFILSELQCTSDLYNTSNLLDSITDHCGRWPTNLIMEAEAACTKSTWGASWLLLYCLDECRQSCCQIRMLWVGSVAFWRPREPTGVCLPENYILHFNLFLLELGDISVVKYMEKHFHLPS